ncbi:uncharacterized protein Z519_04917 [Cladophialophora bantiana CBS 173.52]|uniref:Uncharacterized protein n=1 Tax=Cladophialophora bantiana (strain ATCC 10958 / CBS 173.52 / CDC B-1940 / NIH 8579) TaxID=1442370 RepID=A0A0D2G8J9_CLAB1|nr:uncharacterized protein Z519_04917 [Cladophialophora bantiana CBS 173.52]KIW94937.1 hypothetical protein Z519_04917 [Cladophialophora bantiana CBS 173.52]
MVLWFQLPAEIRSKVYEYVFRAVVFKPLQLPNFPMDTDQANRLPSPSFASLAVCRQWKSEVTPYLLPTGTFDFTDHPGDTPCIVSPKAYEVMRHVVILETHCFSTDWLHQVFDKMTQVRTMTVRKLRKTGPVDNSVFDGPRLTKTFIEKVKIDPIQTLLTGYRFDHIYIKKMLKDKGQQERRVVLEGSLWLADNAETIHSKFAVDLDSWKVRIEGVLEGGTAIEIQAAEPAPVKPAHFEDEEGMFEYMISQHWASLQHSQGIY